MQIKFAHDHKNIKSFEACVDELKPTAIIGLAGAGKLFSKSILEKMAKYNECTGPKLSFCPPENVTGPHFEPDLASNRFCLVESNLKS